MRPWESLLLLADLMAFLVLSIRQVRGRLWMRLAPVIVLLAPVVAATQWLAEGPRWQMLPAYALALLFALVWLLRNPMPMGGLHERERRHPTAAATAITLGALGMVITAALPMMVPIFRFAPPSGAHAISALTYHWVDASRAEALASDHKEPRQLMVQIWYPAQAIPSIWSRTGTSSSPSTSQVPPRRSCSRTAVVQSV